MTRIMVLDDNELMRDSLAETVRRAGYEVDAFEFPLDALGAFRDADYQAVITDLMMPKMSGIEFLREIRALNAQTPVLVITAFGTIETAVQAMKAGAFDYITKPFQPDQIEVLLDKAVEYQRLQAENEVLRARLQQDKMTGTDIFVGQSAAIKALFAQVGKVASTDATVLISGESGTGKEMIARALHVNSDRSDKPFFAVNCAALSAGLLESELFGHEKGAFTGADRMRKGRFELAHTGTLLLDEVSEIEPKLQAKLLRVLQEKSFDRVGSSVSRKVDVRVIATTNRDLKREVAERNFREDLYYRLNVIHLTVPALRERREDIVPLAEFLLGRLGRKVGKSVKKLGGDAKQALQKYSWPGNVRELQNILERAVILSAGDVLGAVDVAAGLEEPPARAVTTQQSGGEFTPCPLEEIERAHIEATLEHFKGNQVRSADALGISDRTLRTKIKQWRAGAH